MGDHMGKDSEGRVPDAKPDHENPAFWRRWVRSLKKWGPLLWFHKRLKKLHEQLEQSPLLVASLWAITGALVAFGVLWILIGFVMHGFWTWGLGPGDTTRADAVRTVLTMIAGVGGIIYLTIVTCQGIRLPRMKWFFYWFYPGHLIALLLIKTAFY